MPEGIVQINNPDSRWRRVPYRNPDKKQRGESKELFLVPVPVEFLPNSQEFHLLGCGALHTILDSEEYAVFW